MWWSKPLERSVNRRDETRGRPWKRLRACARSARHVVQAFRPAVLVLVLASPLWHPSTALAQAPVPSERVTFDEAVRRAVEKNPSAAIAAAGILRAEGLLLD